MDTQNRQATLALSIGTSLEFGTMAKHFLRHLKQLDDIVACGLIPNMASRNEALPPVFAGKPEDSDVLNRVALPLQAQGEVDSERQEKPSRGELLYFRLNDEAGWLLILSSADDSKILDETINAILPNLSVATRACLEHHTQSVEADKDKRHFQMLKQEHTRSHRFIQSVASPILRTNAAGTLVEINPCAEKLFGISACRAIHQTVADLLQIDIQSKKVTKNLNELSRALRTAKDWSSSQAFKIISESGHRRHIEAASQPVFDDNSECIGHIITLNDVTKTERTELRANWQAAHDPVTQLYNRPGFESQLQKLSQEISAPGQRHALLHIDLDQFKIINDTCGHVAGDNLLQQIAMLIRKALRDSDIEGRLGGDEFGVLLSRCGPTKAKKIAENICHAIAQYRFSWKNRLFNPTASIGLTCFDPQHTGPNEAMKQADLACYAAKDNGRNNVYVYRHVAGDFTTERVEEMEWVSRINYAIENDQFTLYCQTIYPLKTHDPMHIEVLIRMLDGDEMVAPGAFLPAAERFGRVQAIDRWVVKNTLDLILKYKHRIAGHYRFNINLAGPTISDEVSQKFILKLLSKHKDIAKRLSFEITETSAIANLSSSIGFIDECQRLGTSFILDDFGTGLSSFVYLKQLPVSQIKIDGTFVRDICIDTVDEAIVTAMQQIAESMNIKTVAEFVENQETVEAIRELGVDFAQGYGLEMPLPFHQKLEELSLATTAESA